jgi:hypothetical protein
VISRSALWSTLCQFIALENEEMTDNMYRRFDACSYDCARRHNEKTETALWLQHRYRTVNKAWLSDWED